jgi:cell division protein FtsQ
LRQDVLRTAGLAKGQNIFSVEPEETSKKLLESPWISSVRVSRKLPGTVRLEIGERKPQAIALVGSQNYLVSEDGVPFKRLGQGDPHDFPLITGISLEALAKDRRAELARIVDALSLLRDYEHLSVFKKYPAQELHLESSGNAVLTVGGEGVSLHLGQAPWKQKLLRAEKVLSATRRAGGKANVVFLDNVAHPERVVVRVH